MKKMHFFVLSWWTTVVCPLCGYVEEGGGDWRAPEELRQLLMQQDGVWGIKILIDADRVPAVKLIREIYSISLKEVSVILKNNILWEGTVTEIDWLFNIMNSKKISSVVKFRIRTGV